MPPPRRSRLTETDRAEWASYVRTVASLPGRARPEPSAQPLPAPPSAVPPAADALPATPPSRRAALSRLEIGLHPPGIDKATWHRFRSGKLIATRILDLHGRTAQMAFHALTSFLHTAHAEQHRCVEIITGRGSGEAGGVLRRELPLWLNQPELRPLVLATAHPHAANTGSVRVLLRRAR